MTTSDDSRDQDPRSGDTYEELIDQSLTDLANRKTAAPPELAPAEVEASFEQQTGYRLHVATIVLFISALCSLVMFASELYGVEDGLLSWEEATSQVLDDIERLPQSSRAKQVARAFSQFLFAVDSRRVEAADWERNLEALRGELNKTGEDSALVATLEACLEPRSVAPQ